MARIPFLIALLALGVTASCSSGTAPTTGGNTGGNNGGNTGGSGSTSSTVGVYNNYYTPKSTTVPAGTTITWAWHSCSDSYGGSCATHSIVFDDGAPGSEKMNSGSFTRTFASGGTYTYHCGVHGAAMTGSIKVQ